MINQQDCQPTAPAQPSQNQAEHLHNNASNRTHQPTYTDPQMFQFQTTTMPPVYIPPPPHPTQYVHYPTPGAHTYPPPPSFRQNNAFQETPLQPVYVHAPPFAPIVHAATYSRDAWTTGLFDCLDDPCNALITLFCPCVTFGEVVEIVDQGSTSCILGSLYYIMALLVISWTCPLTCYYRRRLRRSYNLGEYPLPDWLIHLLCESCALCQEYRELRNRGFDPSLGWNGNVMRHQAMQRPQVATVPPMNQTMMA